MNIITRLKTIYHHKQIHASNSCNLTYTKPFKATNPSLKTENILKIFYRFKRDTFLSIYIYFSVQQPSQATQFITFLSKDSIDRMPGWLQIIIFLALIAAVIQSIK